MCIFLGKDFYEVNTSNLASKTVGDSVGDRFVTPEIYSTLLQSATWWEEDVDSEVSSAWRS